MGRAARCGPVRWSLVGLSVLGSAVSVAAVGCFCALIYPILKGKHTLKALKLLQNFGVNGLSLRYFLVRLQLIDHYVMKPEVMSLNSQFKESVKGLTL